MVSDLPPDSSPIQIGTSGVYGNRAFTVAGRIIYDYDEGSWNEWHIVLNQGGSGWLSDAQGQYAVTFAEAIAPLPPTRRRPSRRPVHVEEYGVRGDRDYRGALSRRGRRTSV